MPVRFHDFAKYAGRIELDIWGVTLSYVDMDLATPDHTNWAQSVRETKRVIDITRKLKSYLPNTLRPLIIANIGGFTMDATFTNSDKQGFYNRFSENLQRLVSECVKIFPQTRTPFPWRFGGQHNQNLFV